MLMAYGWESAAKGVKFLQHFGNLLDENKHKVSALSNIRKVRNEERKRSKTIESQWYRPRLEQSQDSRVNEH